MHAAFAELKLLEVQPLPENLTVVDLSWYEYFTVLFYWVCGEKAAYSFRLLTVFVL